MHPPDDDDGDNKTGGIEEEEEPDGDGDCDSAGGGGFGGRGRWRKRRKRSESVLLKTITGRRSTSLDNEDIAPPLAFDRFWVASEEDREILNRLVDPKDQIIQVQRRLFSDLTYTYVRTISFSYLLFDVLESPCHRFRRTSAVAAWSRSPPTLCSLRP